MHVPQNELSFAYRVSNFFFTIEDNDTANNNDSYNNGNGDEKGSC